MITRLLDFCLRERLVVLLAAVAVAAYGWHAIQTVPLDAIPDVGENQVIVLSEWPGRSPKDMEDQITYPLGRPAGGAWARRASAVRACLASASCR